MTISLEEHVARAIWKARHTRKPYEAARAYEREGVACEACAAIAAAREHARAELTSQAQCLDMGYGPSIRESERAACEAIIEDQINLLRQNGAWGSSELQNVQHKIAARKGKGEGK